MGDTFRRGLIHGQSLALHRDPGRFLSGHHHSLILMTSFGSRSAASAWCRWWMRVLERLVDLSAYVLPSSRDRPEHTSQCRPRSRQRKWSTTHAWSNCLGVEHDASNAFTSQARFQEWRGVHDGYSRACECDSVDLCDSSEEFVCPENDFLSPVC